MSGSNKEKVIVKLWVIIATIFLSGVLVGFSYGRSSTLFLIALEIIAMSILLYVFNKSINEFAYRILGLIGEYKVGVLLKSLYSKGVRSVNSVELEPRGDIDHIAIDASGVWVLETKYIDGEITFRDGVLKKNGRAFKKDFIKQTQGEEWAVRRHLASTRFRDVTIRPVLVFSGERAKVRFKIRPINGVYVVGAFGVKYLLQEVRWKKELTLHDVEELRGIFREYER